MTNPAGQLRLFRSGRESGPRYGSLLLILVVTYLLSAFTVARLVSAVQVVLFLAVVLIALRNGRFHRKTVRSSRWACYSARSSPSSSGSSTPTAPGAGWRACGQP